LNIIRGGRRGRGKRRKVLPTMKPGRREVMGLGALDKLYVRNFNLRMELGKDSFIIEKRVGKKKS